MPNDKETFFFFFQTSIMAVEFDGGVIIGADSRTSSGVYVANRVSDKLTEISDRIYCCRSGSSADTQSIADKVKLHLNLHRYSTFYMLLVILASICGYCITAFTIIQTLSFLVSFTKVVLSNKY